VTIPLDETVDKLRWLKMRPPVVTGETTTKTQLTIMNPCIKCERWTKHKCIQDELIDRSYQRTIKDKDTDTERTITVDKKHWRPQWQCERCHSLVQIGCNVEPILK